MANGFCANFNEVIVHAYDSKRLFQLLVTDVQLEERKKHC